MQRKTQIIATIGPASRNEETLLKMIPFVDSFRLNFSWGDHVEMGENIDMIRSASSKCGKPVSIIQDLSGPRVQTKEGHHFKDGVQSAITEKDLKDLAYGIERKVDYVALSYVGGADDITKLRLEMNRLGRLIPVIAKIERREAVDHIEEIIDTADAIMIARGDLGEAYPIEEIPFLEHRILSLCNKKGRFVIVATEMLLSMVESDRPTRAEVTDVAYAVTGGTSAVMLSNETAQGVNPANAVEVLDRIVRYAEEHHSL